MVILTKRVHRQGPNTSDPKIFTDWLIAKRRQFKEESEKKWALVFPDLTPERNKRIRTILYWYDDKDVSLYDLTETESTMHFGAGWDDSQDETNFMLRKLIDSLGLFDCPIEEIEKRLEERKAAIEPKEDAAL